MDFTFIEVDVRNSFMKHFIAACLMENSGLGLRDREGDACAPEWCAYDATLAAVEKEYDSEADIKYAKKYLRQLYAICFRHCNTDCDEIFPF